MEHKADLKGMVIINLPPPHTPDGEKSVCAAFAIRQQQQQQQCVEEARESPPLPLHHRLPAPPHLRRFSIFRLFRFKKTGAFLFVGFLAFVVWQWSPPSTDWARLDSEKKESGRSFIYSLYSKVQIGLEASESLSPPKLVARDSVRNNLDPDKVSFSAINGSSTTVFPIRGNVYPHGLYYISLRVGNPARPYYLDIDTGSDLSWLQCDAPCTSCAKGPHPLYIPKKNQLVHCNQAICSLVQSGGAHQCAGVSNQCDYEIEYADGSSTMGVLVSDSVTLLVTNGTLVKSTSVFGCAYDQQGSLALSPAKTDGMLGLSGSKVSLPSQWAEQGVVNNVIAHCISGNGNGVGYLFFGDDLIPSRGMTWVPMLGRPSERNYRLSMEKVHLGNSVISIDNSVDANHGVTIFDSGTSYTYLVSQVYLAVVSVVMGSSSSSGLKQDPLDSTLPICLSGSSPFRSLRDVRHLFKDITLVFKGGGWFSNSRQMQIPPEGYLIVNSKGNVCLGILDASTFGDRSPNIIGDITMQGNLVVYDNANNRVGWMRTDCGKLPRSTSPSSLLL